MTTVEQPTRSRIRSVGVSVRSDTPSTIKKSEHEICPAGIDCAADAMERVDAVIVAVDPGHLAVAAAEDSALEAHLIEHLWEIRADQNA